MAKIIGYRYPRHAYPHYVAVGPRMQLVGFGADPSTTTTSGATPTTSSGGNVAAFPGLGPFLSDDDIKHYAAVAVDAAWPAIETKLDAKIDEYKRPLYVAAAVSAAAYVFLLSLIMRRR